jgi:hypothetical protein
LKKKRDKCKKNGKNKKQISKIQKTQKQNKRGKKRGKEGKSKREENEGKIDLSWKNAKKMPTKKANRKSKINAKKCKWTSPFVPMFFPF